MARSGEPVRDVLRHLEHPDEIQIQQLVHVRRETAEAENRTDEGTREQM